MKNISRHGIVFNEIVIINGSTLNFTKQILYRLCYFLLYLKAMLDLITLLDFKAISTLLRRNLKNHQSDRFFWYVFKENSTRKNRFGKVMT